MSDGKKEKICGMELDKIRKAYFTNKIPKMLTDIQASGDYTPEEYEKLSQFLETLKKQGESLTSTFMRFLPVMVENEGDSILDELNKENLSEAELAELEKDKKNRSMAVAYANQVMRELFREFAQGKPYSEERLMDMAFELLGIQYYLNRDMIYKERLYRKSITEFERTGRQRKLAEEYAKMGIAYREFALAEGLVKMVTEFINLAKKRYKNL